MSEYDEIRAAASQQAWRSSANRREPVLTTEQKRRLAAKARSEAKIAEVSIYTKLSEKYRKAFTEIMLANNVPTICLYEAKKTGATRTSDIWHIPSERANHIGDGWLLRPYEVFQGPYVPKKESGIVDNRQISYGIAVFEDGSAVDVLTSTFVSAKTGRTLVGIGTAYVDDYPYTFEKNQANKVLASPLGVAMIGQYVAERGISIPIREQTPDSSEVAAKAKERFQKMLDGVRENQPLSVDVTDHMGFDPDDTKFTLDYDKHTVLEPNGSQKIYRGISLAVQNNLANRAGEPLLDETVMIIEQPTTQSGLTYRYLRRIGNEGTKEIVIPPENTDLALNSALDLISEAHQSRIKG